jgi:hypothetical protein
MATKYYDYLFANPSFLEGVARLLDLGSTLNIYYEDILSEDEEDYYAMKRDWNLVAHDLKSAINEYGKEIKHFKEKR